MFHAVVKVVSFVASLVLAGAMGLIASVFGAGYASGGTITGTYSVDYRSPVLLVGAEDFAVWGGPSLTATATKNVGLLNYTLSGSGEVAFNGYAAVFGTGTSWTPGGIYWEGSQNGAAFGLQAELNEGSRLDLWILTNGPVSVSAVGSSYDMNGTPVVSEAVTLPAFKYSLLSFTGSGLAGPLSVQMTGISESSSQAAQFILGGAAIMAVPEPEYWLAGLMLAAGAGLYIVIVWGSGWFISHGDGDKRD